MLAKKSSIRLKSLLIQLAPEADDEAHHEALKQLEKAITRYKAWDGSVPISKQRRAAKDLLDSLEKLRAMFVGESLYVLTRSTGQYGFGSIIPFRVVLDSKIAATRAMVSGLDSSPDSKGSPGAAYMAYEVRNVLLALGLEPSHSRHDRLKSTGLGPRANYSRLLFLCLEIAGANPPGNMSTLMRRGAVLGEELDGSPLIELTKRLSETTP